jgi:hypothetical protein
VDWETVGRIQTSYDRIAKGIGPFDRFAKTVAAVDRMAKAVNSILGRPKVRKKDGIGNGAVYRLGPHVMLV